jgi:hypothetical protein
MLLERLDPTDIIPRDAEAISSLAEHETAGSKRMISVPRRPRRSPASSAMPQMAIVTVSILSACGRPHDAQEAPVSHGTVAAGVYVGAGSGAKDPPHFIALIDTAGVARIAEYTGPTSAISSSVYAPRQLLRGTRVSSSLAVYHAGENSAGTGTLIGTLGRSELVGTIIERSGKHSFVLRSDPSFATPAPLDTLAGGRTLTYGSPGPVRRQLHLDATGGISGSDDAGCHYRGRLTVRDPGINIYDVSLSSSCVRGPLSGLAVYFIISGRLLMIVTGGGGGFTFSSNPGP